MYMKYILSELNCYKLISYVLSILAHGNKTFTILYLFRDIQKSSLSTMIVVLKK